MSFLSLATVSLLSLCATTEATCPAANPSGPISIKVAVFIDPSALQFFKNSKQAAEKYIRARYAGATKNYAENPVKFSMDVVSVTWLSNQRKQPLQAEICPGKAAMNPMRLVAKFLDAYNEPIKAGKAVKADYWSGFGKADLSVGVNGVGMISGMCTFYSGSAYFISNNIMKQQEQFGLFDRTVAHETGHVLGWHHDNPNPAPEGNGCPEAPKGGTVHLMQNGSTTGQYSTCTAKEISETLGCLGCLLGTNAQPANLTAQDIRRKLQPPKC